MGKTAKKTKPPKLPELLSRKLYKTGQTRGADDDVIYQNRVSRKRTVLIPWPSWGKCSKPKDGSNAYENGYIVLIAPSDYFDATKREQFEAQKLSLGKNALVFFENRKDWLDYSPTGCNWKPAKNRTAPLGGEYVARIPATTAHKDAKKIVEGFTKTKAKGAGIRVFEYASQTTLQQCRLQLEAVFWMCYDAQEQCIANGMSPEDTVIRKETIFAQCKEKGLLDINRLRTARIINSEGKAICPFCLEKLSATGFFNKVKQAAGREVNDLTITELNLFHIDELRVGETNHKPYNLGWGHHHCNVVVKDEGITKTLQWLRDVLARNDAHNSSAN